MPHRQKLPSCRSPGICFSNETPCHYNVYITIGRGRGRGLGAGVGLGVFWGGGRFENGTLLLFSGVRNPNPGFIWAVHVEFGQVYLYGQGFFGLARTKCRVFWPVFDHF